jgi:hypothetical protein
VLSLRDFRFRWALAAVVIIKAGMATNRLKVDLKSGVGPSRQHLEFISEMSEGKSVDGSL